ncbi:hypothetical protein KY331_00930 [Candidatus Woesearchaeota archaeon]|nr:hypothetical protein [Candidatus Woesearchaeota archaeon]
MEPHKLCYVREMEDQYEVADFFEEQREWNLFTGLPGSFGADRLDDFMERIPSEYITPVLVQGTDGAIYGGVANGVVQTGKQPSFVEMSFMVGDPAKSKGLTDRMKELEFECREGE